MLVRWGGVWQKIKGVKSKMLHHRLRRGEVPLMDGVKRAAVEANFVRSSHSRGGAIKVGERNGVGALKIGVQAVAALRALLSVRWGPKRSLSRARGKGVLGVSIIAVVLLPYSKL